MLQWWVATVLSAVSVPTFLEDRAAFWGASVTDKRPSSETLNSTWNFSSETLRKILAQSKARLSLKGQNNDLLVEVGGCGAAHHVQETMISSTFFELGTCQRPKTIEAGGMTVPGGTMYESLNVACSSHQIEDWGNSLNKGDVIV